MTPSSFSRTGGSTRSFATTDPERQGVFVGGGRSALPKIAFTQLPSSRTVAPQAHGANRVNAFYRASSAAPK